MFDFNDFENSLYRELQAKGTIFLHNFDHISFMPMSTPSVSYDKFPLYTISVEATLNQEDMESDAGFQRLHQLLLELNWKLLDTVGRFIETHGHHKTILRFIANSWYRYQLFSDGSIVYVDVVRAADNRSLYFRLTSIFLLERVDDDDGSRVSGLRSTVIE